MICVANGSILLFPVLDATTTDGVQEHIEADMAIDGDPDDFLQARRALDTDMELFEDTPNRYYLVVNT